ncbi:serine hydrolase [Paenibacillus sp. L3-i20]|uniref:serine hydrolase domain-containing protein n=1 Tax=Paenibacillus sp. L3-i20 TaxID=2905833 RepID=UPI001EDEEF62|nr:serine hydrolase domain-containing protein [Paenibacillus sp. L3-i20]GKU77540.1 penicillin-binding protein [Paenibacillus sp. L3-i20]
MFNLSIRTFLIAVIVTTTSLLVPTQSRAESKEESSQFEKIDALVESTMAEYRIPGASVGIVKGNQTIYMKGYGISGPDQTPVTPQTPFVLGSTTKSITAAAIMQLVDNGKIDLDAPVQRYLPSFQLADKEASETIVVKHLLHQTSGLSTYDGQAPLTKGDKPLEEHLNGLENISLLAAVGSEFNYSNLNYDILGGIIQAVSGLSYSDYVVQHIFKPLNMKHSYASPKEAQNAGLATGYQPVFGRMIPTKQLRHEGTLPSGYLMSSAEDMSSYLIAHMNGGVYNDNIVFSEDSVRQMHEPASSMWGGMHYAMGWTVHNNLISHDGSTENTYSKMQLDGEYGIVILINAMDVFHIDNYDYLMTGISNILQKKEPLPLNTGYTKTYVILDLIVLAAIVFILYTIYGLFSRKNKKQPTKLRTVLNVAFILIFHLLLPGALLLLLPKLLVPWPVVLTFLPGIGHALIILPLVLMVVGAIKIAIKVRKRI